MLVYSRLSIASMAAFAALLITLSHAVPTSAQDQKGDPRSAPSVAQLTPIAAPDDNSARQCTSISSKSNRCHQTFAADCKKRGQSALHCAQMAGFCHGCTDAYAMCKGDMQKVREQQKTSSADCTTCNSHYSRCIQRMVDHDARKS